MAVNSSFKNMTLCLFAVCLVCSAMLACVYALTKEPIEAASAAKTNNAIAQVVPQFDGEPAPAVAEVGGKEYSYYSVAKDGETVGYAILTSAVGFSGPVSLMVGITADGIVYNTTVLSQSETPGLGAKCVDPAFSGQFRNLDPAEKKLSVKKDGGDIDAITASTITSRAYTRAVATAVAVYGAITGTLDEASQDAVSGATVATDGDWEEDNEQ